MKIGTREVGPNAPVFIIAEAGSNHGGSLDRALALIDAAADAGADAAKFQRFRVDNFLIPRPDSASLRKYELPDDWLPLLKERCSARGIEFLCTAFDLEGFDIIDPFVNAHKVGSWEAGLFKLMLRLESFGKPVLASEGKTRGPGVAGNNVTNLIRLHCVSEYPAPIDGYLRGHPVNGTDTNYLPSQWLWGVSDHTLDPTIVPAAAVALGACVVEKHMNIWPDNAGVSTPDAGVSIWQDDFKKLVEAVRLTEKAVRG